MKKLFALLITMGTLSSVFAQQGRQKNEKDGFNNKTTYADNYSFSKKEKDMQIDRINHDFDQKIQSVRRDRRMRSNDKSRQISMLERQRDQQIREVNNRFASSKDRRYDDGYAKNNNRRF